MLGGETPKTYFAKAYQLHGWNMLAYLAKLEAKRSKKNEKEYFDLSMVAKKLEDHKEWFVFDTKMH